jgi:hypothetical protein
MRESPSAGWAADDVAVSMTAPRGSLVARQQSSHGGTQRRDAEWLVNGGNVGGKIAHPAAPGDVINVKNGKRREVLPYPGDELGPAETGHVIVGDDEIEFGLGCARRVQRRAAVGHGNDLEAIIGERPADQRSNHRLVVDHEDAVGHRALAQK